MEDSIAQLIDLAMWPLGFFLVSGIISSLSLLVLFVRGREPKNLRTRKAES